MSVIAIPRETIFSECRKYRFTLWRQWQPELLTEPVVGVGNVAKDGYVQFIGLNPSVADEKINDNTIRRCINYCQAWGYSELCMTNLFPFRATLVKDMLVHDEPMDIAYKNAQIVEKIAEGAALIIFAWGNDGKHKRRGEKFVKHLRDIRKFKVHHLGLNSDGSPKHPLYLPKTLKPIAYA